MRTAVYVVPDAEMAIINKYLSFESGVVLIPESKVNAVDPDGKLGLRELNKDCAIYDLCYDFGDECDVSVDIVESKCHYFIDYMRSERGIDEEQG